MRKSQQKPAEKVQPPVKGKPVPVATPAEPKPFNINDYAKDGITKDEVLEFKSAFDIFDYNGSGKVEVADIKEAFMNLGFHHQSIFAQNVLAHIEKKGPEIEFGEFIRIATAKLNEDYTQPETNLVFTAFDPKGAGTFSLQDLKNTIRGIGEDISDEEIEKMFRAAAVGESKVVTAEDFYNIVTKKAYK